MEYCVRPCVQSLVLSKPAQEKEGKRGGKTPSKEGLGFLLPGHLACRTLCPRQLRRHVAGILWASGCCVFS